YEPYSMKLEDVRFDKYIGTNTAKNYSSKVHLSDKSRDVDADVTIWMNNPLRYAGQTFYQSSVGADPITGEESTGLQVVTNTVGALAMPPHPKEGEFDLYAAGSIPVVSDGRVKPLDSLARNTLQAISNRETLKVPVDGYRAAGSEENPKMKSQPAMRWMLDLI